MDMLRNRLWPPPVEPGVVRGAKTARDRRSATRFDVDVEVTLSARGRIPITALVFNMSRSGAAIRIHGAHVPVPEPWPVRLRNGDELWVAGIVDEPIFSWVVAFMNGVLRVHFALEDEMQTKLRKKFPFL
jgi:hypothetical protein